MRVIKFGKLYSELPVAAVSCLDSNIHNCDLLVPVSKPWDKIIKLTTP